jgi:hypothetical protein
VGPLTNLAKSSQRTEFSRRFEIELADIVITRPLFEFRPFFHQIQTYGFELRALKVIERDPRLMDTLKSLETSPTNAGGSSVNPERLRRIEMLRGFYIHFLIRAGHFARARRLLKTIHRKDADALYREALIAHELWDYASARELLEKACEHDDASPLMIITRHQIEARCLFMASRAPVGSERVRQVEALLPEAANDDLSGAVTLAYADTLALNGETARALQVTTEKITEITRRMLIDIPSNPIHLAELHLLSARCRHALGEPRADFERNLNSGLRLALQESENYLYLLHHVFERVRAFGWTEGQRLLQSLRGHLPGFDPANLTGAPQPPEYHPNLLKLSPGTRLAVDLACNEYRFSEDVRPRLGIPLEVRLIGWMALVSPLSAVPRTLLLDLLWPDAPAGHSQLQNRLSKLLARAESLYGISLRNGSEEVLRMTTQAQAQVQVGIGPPGERPSFFRNASSAKIGEVAEHYGLKRSRATHWMKVAMESGWLCAAHGPQKSLKKGA